MKQFDDFRATELLCPSCRRAMPVRRSLLLVLPDGELFQLRCASCGTVVGTKRETGRKELHLTGEGGDV